jgi:cytochrome bd-type quinol oxidase subunit 2
MIQRIQSLYLLLAAIISIVVLFLTIGTIYTDEFMYTYNCFTVKEACPNGGNILATYYIAAALICSALLSIITIFMYKKRNKQRTFNSVNMIIYLIALILMLYVYPNVVLIKKEIMASPDDLHFNYWILLSLVPAILLYLSNRAIRKDEELIRSTERLR